MGVRSLSRVDEVVAAWPRAPWRRPVRVVLDGGACGVLERLGCRVCMADCPEIGLPGLFATEAGLAEHLEAAHGEVLRRAAPARW